MEALSALGLTSLLYSASEVRKRLRIAMLTAHSKMLKHLLVNLNTHMLLTDHDWLSLNSAEPQTAQRRKQSLSLLLSFLKEHGTAACANGDRRYRYSARCPPRILDQLARDDEHNRTLNMTLHITGRKHNSIRVRHRTMTDVSGDYGVNIVGSEVCGGLCQSAPHAISLGMYSRSMRKTDKMLIAWCQFKCKSNYTQTELAYKPIEYVVNYHNSGTEAIEAVLRLAKYNTKRAKFVTFDSTYHGWTSQMVAPITAQDNPDHLNIPFLCDESLQCIQENAKDISCVLFNPMCIFCIRQNDQLLEHDRFNVSKSHDMSQVNSFLVSLEKICSLYGIALVFDEIYSAFRFGPSLLSSMCISAIPDIVVVGKTIGCGIPCGIAIGANHFLSRQLEAEGYNRPAIQGTFTNSTRLSTSVRRFLSYISSRQGEYEALFGRLDRMINEVNHVLSDTKNAPIRLRRFGMLVTTDFLILSPYNFLLQFYLLRHCIYTCCYGSSRMNFNLSFRDGELVEFKERFIKAVVHMMRDAWFEGERRSLVSHVYLLKLVANTLIQRTIKEPFDYIMLAKRIDLDVSHHNRVNFMTHYFSSLLTLYGYYICMMGDTYRAMYLFLFCQIIRQMGHFLFEVPDDEAEDAKIGFNNSSKKTSITLFILLSVLSAPFNAMNPHQMLLRSLIIIMCLKVASSCSQIGVQSTLCWLVKIVTDMLTDLADMGPAKFIDFFTDKEIRERTLNENFVPKYMPNGHIDLAKIIRSYLGINLNYGSRLLESSNRKIPPESHGSLHERSADCTGAVKMGR